MRKGRRVSGGGISAFQRRGRGWQKPASLPEAAGAPTTAWTACRAIAESAERPSAVERRTRSLQGSEGRYELALNVRCRKQRKVPKHRKDRWCLPWRRPGLTASPSPLQSLLSDARDGGPLLGQRSRFRV